MGRSGDHKDYISIVEACYERLDEDHGAWVSQLLHSSGALLDLGGGLGFSLVREADDRRKVELSRGLGSVGDMVPHSWSVIEQLEEDVYRQFYYPTRPVVLASALVKQFAQPHQQTFARMMGLAGSRDLLGMVGYPAPGWAFALFVAIGGETRIVGALRETLRRLRIHIEAGLRLRMFSSAQAVAVISPEGRVEHAATEVQAARGGLRERARAIEEARRRSSGDDPQRALAAWHALVEGRWSLVERLDTDRKRVYLAFENAPNVRAFRALTRTEALVVELSLRGLTGKEVAYTTGLSQARISAALGGAAERLGFSCRADLMCVAGTLRQAEVGRVARLTTAEREVLALVRRGLSNRAIAERRNVSVHTVAKQLASLCRKTGASSRRALLLLPR